VSVRRSGGRPARLRDAITGHFIFSVRTALEAVSHNKLRASLTSLGILFGVASVIAMLAIGKGAEQEILEQMQLLGSNNVIVMPLVEQTEEDLREDQSERQLERVSPGLTRADASAIEEVISAVDATSGEIVLNTAFTREGLRRSGKVVGVDTTYFPLMNLDIASGRPFTIAQVERGMPVAIIGHGVRSRFFTMEEALGRRIKVGNVWLTVIGVLEDRRFRGDASLRLGIRDANMDVYVPITTMLRRFRDRTRVTQRDIELASRPQGMPDESGAGETDEQRTERTNRNQLDRIVVRVRESSLVPGVADVIQRILERRHNAVVDFEITVPEALLRQEQRTKTIFNVVLGAIASISLVVGGIGIMNIMLASILERIREIGVRRAVGATRREILLQFLSEAVLISLAGGVAGILVGAGLSSGIERAAGITTVVSYLSVLVAFGVAVAVGLVFGIVPAYRAAHQDPVACLRHE
jgi:putative ABC transport system permease protein